MSGARTAQFSLCKANSPIGSNGISARCSISLSLSLLPLSLSLSLRIYLSLSLPPSLCSYSPHHSLFPTLSFTLPFSLHPSQSASRSQSINSLQYPLPLSPPPSHLNVYFSVSFANSSFIIVFALRFATIVIEHISVSIAISVSVFCCCYVCFFYLCCCCFCFLLLLLALLLCLLLCQLNSFMSYCCYRCRRRCLSTLNSVSSCLPASNAQNQVGHLCGPFPRPPLPMSFFRLPVAFVVFM